MLDFPRPFSGSLQSFQESLLENNSDFKMSREENGGGNALANLQRLLSSQLANVSPLQLQQVLQRQQQQQLLAAGRQQLQSMLASLQEQLQINLLQQTHLGSNKQNSSGAISQLQSQQQQLVAQMQMTQQALMLGGTGVPCSEKESEMSSSRERHCSESLGSDGSLKENRPETNGLTRSRANSISDSSSPPPPPPPSSSSTDTLLSHGRCTWPGCDTDGITELGNFYRHLSSFHSSNDKSLAQTRVQQQIVTQLEFQWRKEKERLEAMMSHLHLEFRNGELRGIPSDVVTISAPRKVTSSSSSSSPSTDLKASSSSLPASSSILSSPLSALSSAVRSPHFNGSLRFPSKNDKSILPPGFDERRGRGDRGNPNLDPALDIQQNREFYKHNDVRPPYTYAALIRYAVQESPDKQLTLHEVYNWFTTTFAYFRRNAASWKNAVRHNLSLHKCFLRVENVKGAVWTVDDEEYHRRRPPRGVSQSVNSSPTLTPASPSLLDQSLSSMLAAASHAGTNFFNPALFQHAGQRAAAAAAFAAHLSNDNIPRSGRESPANPFPYDNRSTPGSIDLSRIKNEDKDDLGRLSHPDEDEDEDGSYHPLDENDEDLLEDDAQDLSLNRGEMDE